MRKAGENAFKAFQEFAVAIDYREDVYKAMKAFADTHPKLSGEDEKLLKETMRDYRRAGLDLPPDKRKEVEATAQATFKSGNRFQHQRRQRQGPGGFHQSGTGRHAGKFSCFTRREDRRRRLHRDGECHMAFHHRGGKREERSDPQEALPGSRFSWRRTRTRQC